MKKPYLSQQTRNMIKMFPDYWQYKLAIDVLELKKACKQLDRDMKIPQIHKWLAKHLEGKTDFEIGLISIAFWGIIMFLIIITE